MRIDVVYGTATPPGRLATAMRSFEAALRAAGATVSAVDLSATALPPAGTLAPADVPAAARALLDSIAAADAVVVFSPIFRAAAPGVLKSFFDLLPIEALEGKPVGSVAMGATPHHYLAVDIDLHPILAWFGAITIPAGPYLTARSFEEGKLSAEAETALGEYAQTVVELARRLAGVTLRPRPLAAAAR